MNSSPAPSSRERARIAGGDAVACPVDGCVSEAGTIQGDRLLQAKGRDYALAELLAAQPWASRFEGGSFATIYLAPFNYHRVHMPLRGELKDTVYVPGRLFSVNDATARHVPRLFARNERVLTLFDTAHGQMALMLVGALNVGSMATVWAGDITPAARRRVTRLPARPTVLDKGAELGRFNMGSTVILLFEPQRVRWHRRGARRQCGAAGASRWAASRELASDRRLERSAAPRRHAGGGARILCRTRRARGGNADLERRRRERSADRILDDSGRRSARRRCICAPRLNTP